MRMLKIAICEDSEIFVEIIKKNIETILKVPYELHPFLSGREFMTSLPEMGCPYDIVFLDISLGEDTVSGIELGQMINGENPRTQLIFISQYLEYASDVYSTNTPISFTKTGLMNICRLLWMLHLKISRQMKNSFSHLRSDILTSELR